MGQRVHPLIDMLRQRDRHCDRARAPVGSDVRHAVHRRESAEDAAASSRGHCLATLQHAALQLATLQLAALQHCSLQHCSIAACSMQHCSLQHCSLQLATLQLATLQLATLQLAACNIAACDVATCRRTRPLRQQQRARARTAHRLLRAAKHAQERARLRLTGRSATPPA